MGPELLLGLVLVPRDQGRGGHPCPCGTVPGSHRPHPARRAAAAACNASLRRSAEAYRSSRAAMKIMMFSRLFADRIVVQHLQLQQTIRSYSSVLTLSSQ